MMLNKRIIFFRAAVCLALLALSACASTNSLPESLDLRAQARWDALLERDFEKAYAYLTPGTRSSQTLAEYTTEFSLRKVQYNSAQYIDEDCVADACTVRMNMGYTLIAPLRGVQEWKSKATIEEKWVRIDGQWWFLPKS